MFRNIHVFLAAGWAQMLSVPGFQSGMARLRLLL